MQGGAEGTRAAPTTLFETLLGQALGRHGARSAAGMVGWAWASIEDAGPWAMAPPASQRSGSLGRASACQCVPYFKATTSRQSPDLLADAAGAGR